MKHLVTFFIILSLSLLLVYCATLDYKVTNLERQLMRIEQQYDAVLAENEKLVRINDQNLMLLTQGGWEWTQY